MASTLMPQKQWQTLKSQNNLYLSQIDLPTPNLCCIAWSKLREEFASDETAFFSLEQAAAILAWSSKPLNTLNHFTYLSRNISSTESDINKRIGDVWTVIVKLLSKGKFISVIKENWISSKPRLSQYFCMDALHILKKKNEKLDGKCPNMPQTGNTVLLAWPNYDDIYHNHHVTLTERIPPPSLSRFASQSCFAPCRSSKLHHVSTQSCCSKVLVGRPTLVIPFERLHRRRSRMSSFFLLLQGPPCLVRLTRMVLEMGGKWPYCCFFMICPFQYFFNIPRSFFSAIPV